MRNIVLTSCGIINEDFKNRFYELVSKEELKNKKILYITTASDGEPDDDKSWMETELKTILDLGISERNIVEYKIGKSNVDINDFDIIYMMGGNTFYLLDVIRKTHFDKEIFNFINNGKIYIGSSAGSEILGNSIEPALGYDDNNVGMTDYTGLKIIDGLIIPHCNRKKDFIESLKNSSTEKLILLYDGDGIIVGNMINRMIQSELAKYKDDINKINEDIKIDCITIFSSSDEDYNDLNTELNNNKIVDKMSGGNLYYLNNPINTDYGKLFFIKVRKHDDNYNDYKISVDFTVGNYEMFKSKLDNPVIKTYNTFELIQFKNKKSIINIISLSAFEDYNIKGE